MVYERRVSSLKELRGELKALEADSGIRANCLYEGRKSFVFITRHSGRYAIWMRPRAARGAQGEAFMTFTGYDGLDRFLGTVLESPLRAFVY